MIKEESFEVDLATDCSPESSTKKKKRRKNKKKQLLMEGVDVMKTKEVGSVGLGESNINSDSNKVKKKKRRKKNTKQSVENSIKAEAGEYESKAENSSKEDSHLSDGGSEKNEKRLIALEDAENERADCVVGENSGEKILESKDGKSDQRNINLDSDKVKKKKKRKKNTKQSVENSIKAEAGEYESKAENSTKEDSHFFDGGSEKNEKRQIALEEAENERADSIVRENCGEKILESNNGKSDQRNIKRKKRLLKEAANADMRGICYLSRVPPHMDPLKLRQILSQYGEIQRIYLAPEDAANQIQRKRAGGFRGQFFSEGWVEFTDKRVAKKVANMLNGEQIGGRKRSSFYFDLWNIKYLSKFKWDDLTEETAYKHAIREQKMALEISAAKRERDFYLSKVEKSRALSSIEERLKKKQKLREGSEMNSVLADSQKLPKLIRTFPQTQPVADSAVQNKQGLSKNILAGVFGSS